ncbi:MAG: EAL domain-containing response regulator [Rhodospirillaceae bacterium]|nr:EAL domain-containing response regulator [Rhodospirillaceae bacterium]
MAEPNAGMRALVVDGQAVPRRMTAKMIKDCGVTEVLEAESAEAALSLLEADEAGIDLMLTDLRFNGTASAAGGRADGGMDGIELVRRVAESNLASYLLIATLDDAAVVRSVAAMASALGLEMAGHVKKPISPESLRPLILRQIARRVTAPLLRARSVHVTAEELRYAITTQQFVPHFQPRVRAGDGSVTAVEALIRWQHPERGLVPPGAFMPLADRVGLIEGITDVVLEKSISWARRWQDAGIDIAVSVNLTGEALLQTDLPKRVANLADAHGIARNRIVLEVTEAAVVTDAPYPIETLARLRLLGLGLAIDDFGTGMATLEQLQRMPFTEVKIDQALVTGVFEQPQFRPVLEKAIRLARTLGLKTVAEGIESKADWDLLNELGCDELQGFFVARPMPAEEIEGWAQGWHRQPL